ncbi:hypothetical protein AVEN_257304-1 [Araneus ventricosus]|uniref:Uncharacterized protein n=1 Tax=Araneus ventricosus TaxID=182803 RepID=A0A4Y2SB25_ARAVE|nr:hypothetical protein AVEN_257304-1 [Araneus ventricosus]
MKNLLIVIGFWVTVGSNFFIHAGEEETTPYGGSIRESLGENPPAGFPSVIFNFSEGRCGLMVRSRRISGSKPDYSENSPCMRVWLMRNPPLWVKRPPAGVAEVAGWKDPFRWILDTKPDCTEDVGLVHLKSGVVGQTDSRWCGAEVRRGGVSSSVVLVI